MTRALKTRTNAVNCIIELSLPSKRGKENVFGNFMVALLSLREWTEINYGMPI